MDKVEKALLGEKEVESNKRMQDAIKEINEVQEKYKVALIAQISYLAEGIIPKVSIIDTKKEETVADKIK